MNRRMPTLKRWTVVLFALLLVVAQTYVVASAWLVKWTTASWLKDRVAPFSQLAADIKGQEIQQLVVNNDDASTWQWHFAAPVESKAPLAWLAAGNHYLLLDERSFPHDNFALRIQHVVDSGATLLYESPFSPFGGPRQAVLWAFRPDQVLNVRFDASLMLIGYNVQHNPDGQISLLFHWYTISPPTINYHLFLHMLEPGSGNVVGQADTELGGGSHPTALWHRNELVFESAALPQNVLVSRAYQIRIGLYDLNSGNRAHVNDDHNQPIGDSIVIELPR